MPNQPRQSPEQSSKAKRPFTYAPCIDEQVHKSPVGDAKGRQDTQVSPLLITIHSKRLHVVAASRERAVFTIARGIAVNEVPWCLVDVCTGVFLTGQSWRRTEFGCLTRCTLDLKMIERGRHHAPDPISGRVGIVYKVLVHAGESLIRSHHAVV